MLMWSTTTVPVNGTKFRPDHIVLLAERPAVPHAVMDTNDSTATCNCDRYSAGDDKVNVADNTSHRCIKSVHEWQRIKWHCGPLWPCAVCLEVLCSSTTVLCSLSRSPLWSFAVFCIRVKWFCGQWICIKFHLQNYLLWTRF